MIKIVKNSFIYISNLMGKNGNCSNQQKKKKLHCTN